MYSDRQAFNRDVIMAWETSDTKKLTLLAWLRSLFS